MRKDTASKIWGIFLILIGISVAGHVFGWWTLRLFQGWWTLFIIVPCIISMIQDGVKTANAVGLGIGVVFLLSERTIISWMMLARLFLPVALVAAGAMLLLKGATSDKKDPTDDNTDRPEEQTLDENTAHAESATTDKNAGASFEHNEPSDVKTAYRPDEETLDQNTAQAEGSDDPIV